MMKRISFPAILTMALLVSLFALAPALQAQPNGTPGAVYTMTNASAGNEILIFDRAPNGHLSMAGSVATGGVGTGGGLGNQAGLILSSNGRHLLAVNAGSDEISVLRIHPHGLELVETAASGGERPVSLALNRGLLYVLHAGGAEGGMDSLVGFRLGQDGSLEMLPGSQTPLSAAATGPAQVGFRPDGRVLAVTEKGTDSISTYVVDRNGYLTGPVVNPSEGMTPFGFAFGQRDQLMVSEAFGGAADASAASSYEVLDDGTLVTLDASEPTTETAACWLALTPGSRFAYTTNTGSGTVTGYSVGFDGDLELLDADGVTGMTGMGSRPIDLAFIPGGRMLYTLNGGNGTISGFRVHGDGSLTPLPTTMGIPAGANGLAAR